MSTPSQPPTHLFAAVGAPTPPEACPFCDRIALGQYDLAGSTLPVVTFEPLNPVTPGHRLFLPMAHVEHPNADPHLGAAFNAAERWGALTGDQFNLITSAGPLATQTVAHVHVHYVPRRPSDGLELPWTGLDR